jgi:hypothetical protein
MAEWRAGMISDPRIVLLILLNAGKESRHVPY